MKQKNTVKINGKDWKIKKTIRSLFIFEQITKKPFEIASVLDSYIYFYSIILASNMDADIPLEWDDFVNALDEDPTLFARMNDIIIKFNKAEKVFENEDEAKDNGEEKKS